MPQRQTLSQCSLRLPYFVLHTTTFVTFHVCNRVWHHECLWVSEGVNRYMSHYVSSLTTTLAGFSLCVPVCPFKTRLKTVALCETHWGLKILEPSMCHTTSTPGITWITHCVSRHFPFLGSKWRGQLSGGRWQDGGVLQEETGVKLGPLWGVREEGARWWHAHS